MDDDSQADGDCDIEAENVLDTETEKVHVFVETERNNDTGSTGSVSPSERNLQRVDSSKEIDEDEDEENYDFEDDGGHDDTVTGTNMDSEEMDDLDRIVYQVSKATASANSSKSELLQNDIKHNETGPAERSTPPTIKGSISKSDSIERANGRHPNTADGTMNTNPPSINCKLGKKKRRKVDDKNFLPILDRKVTQSLPMAVPCIAPFGKEADENAVQSKDSFTLPPVPSLRPAQGNQKPTLISKLTKRCSSITNSVRLPPVEDARRMNPVYLPPSFGSSSSADSPNSKHKAKPLKTKKVNYAAMGIRSLDCIERIRHKSKPANSLRSEAYVSKNNKIHITLKAKRDLLNSVKHSIDRAKTNISIEFVNEEDSNSVKNTRLVNKYGGKANEAKKSKTRNQYQLPDPEVVQLRAMYPPFNTYLPNTMTEVRQQFFRKPAGDWSTLYRELKSDKPYKRELGQLDPKAKIRAVKRLYERYNIKP